MIVGIDFDNTLAEYDHVFRRVAAERQLVTSPAGLTKKGIRDHIRALPGGELLWQAVQAEVYGERMGEASLLEGASEFLETCRARRVPVRIVSHKTRYAAQDRRGIDLRVVSLGWMVSMGFFEARFGLSRGDVHFADTRAQKVDLIRTLGCTHFIDDLEETFLEPGFPTGVSRYLIVPGPRSLQQSSGWMVASWPQIRNDIFNHDLPGDS